METKKRIVASLQQAASSETFETPLGLDPTAVPNFVQHVAAFKAQLDLVQDAVKHIRSATPSAEGSAAQTSKS